MRCYCCNNVLTPYESTIRNSTTKEFIDMCLKCIKTVDNTLNVVGRPDLLNDNNEVNEDINDE